MTGELKRKTGHTDLPRARGGARDHFCFACQSSSKAPSLSPLKFLLVMPTSGQQPRVALQSVAPQQLSLSLSVCLCLCLAACCLSKGSASERPKKGDLCRIDFSLPFHSFGVLQRGQGTCMLSLSAGYKPKIRAVQSPRWCSSVVRASD